MAKKLVVIRDTSNTVQSQTAALTKFFRRSEETVANFAGQIKALGEDGKQELAIGAAKCLGWTVEETEAPATQPTV
jgi:hypothetical protein